MGYFLVDSLCTGVKDSFYRLRLEDYELQDDYVNSYEGLTFRECSYEEAHNRIYGSIAFAEEAGISPDKSFALSKYILEEDTDDIPLIEYEYGLNGKHYLVCDTRREASEFLPILRKHLGENGFEYMITDKLDEKWNDFDENDTDDNETVSEGSSLKMIDLLSEFDEERLSNQAFALGFRFNMDIPIEQLRRQFIKHVKEEPLKVLDHLPANEISMLKALAEDHSLASGLPTFYTSMATFMETFGFAKSQWSVKQVYEIRIADDFAKAVIPYIDELEEEETTAMRYAIEAIFEGMANLYGEVSLPDGRKMLMESLNVDTETANSMISLTLSQSVMLQSMLIGFNELAKGGMTMEDFVFASRYAWTDKELMHSRLQESWRQMPLSAQRFSFDEIIAAASNPLPAIPNDNQETFNQFLDEKLGFFGEKIDDLCFNLWLSLQHENEPGVEPNTVSETFDAEALSMTDKPLTPELQSEAIQMLNDYIAHIPRWTLRGHCYKETHC